jgi:hypothetical protein
MKVTQSMIKAYIKNQLATNSIWALKALTTIYARQTADEQATGTTNNLNSVGFSGADAEILSSLAVQYQKWNRLSDKQMAIVFKKMPRYWNQILSCITDDKMIKVQTDALAYHQSPQQ